jgi:hypothetical protein
VYEWPIKKKVKWPVKELLARRQQRLLKMWLRYVESLRDIEEVVHICEPEAGRNLSDDEGKRSLDDLRNCQVGSEGLSIFQVGNEERSVVDPKDCQVGSNESSSCQVGNDMRSLEDLIDYQEGREEIPYFQVGKGEQMRPCESLMNSEVSLDQQGELMEKDQRCILIIGGIEVFLPSSPVEAKSCVTDATTQKDNQL